MRHNKKYINVWLSWLSPSTEVRKESEGVTVELERKVVKHLPDVEDSWQAWQRIASINKSSQKYISKVRVGELSSL